jgi:hypothetical protein
MPNSYGEILTARGGSYILNDSSTYTNSLFYAVVVLEDTIISELESTDVNGIVNNVLNDHIADPAVAVKAGAILTPMDINKPFSRIAITGGSVMLVLK